MPEEQDPQPTLASAKPNSDSESNSTHGKPAGGTSSSNRDTSFQLNVGTVIGGRYLLERELDGGGFGIVFLARDQQLLSKLVVIKVLRAHMIENDYVLKKFKQEVEALTRLDHPGIVSVLDTGALPDGNPYIVMQYIEGTSLRKVLSPQGMELERAAHIVRSVGRALSFAHDKGILHRDLKPENIMLQTLSDDEQPKIIDFGIARVKDSQIAPETTTDMPIGTVKYMSPEQLNRLPLGPASDIYALGIIAYELVTGRHPFNPESVFQMIDLQRAGLRVPPSALRPSLPAGAETAIRTALEFDPGARFKHAREFGDAFANALSSSEYRMPSSAQENKTLAMWDEDPKVTADDERTREGETATHNHRSTAGAHSQGDQKRRSLSPALLAIPLLVVALGAAAFWYFRGTNTVGPSQQNSASTDVSAPERELSFSLVLQRMADGKPIGKPKQATGQEMYDNGDQFWMTLTSPQSGYLYIINEGSQPRNGMPSYNALFPLNKGSAAVSANQTIETPSRKGQGYFFDAKEGMEKMWLVFSREPVAELEAAKNAANTKGIGEVLDAGTVRSLQDFFAARASAQINSLRDDAAERTILKGKGDLIVYQAQLKHH